MELDIHVGSNIGEKSDILKHFYLIPTNLLLFASNKKSYTVWYQINENKGVRSSFPNLAVENVKKCGFYSKW